MAALSRKALAAAIVFGFLLPGGFVQAADFGLDDSGKVKFTMRSLPFFDEPKEGDEERSGGSITDPDDEEYTTDSIGRKVPVRTHRSGSAITSR